MYINKSNFYPILFDKDKNFLGYISITRNTITENKKDATQWWIGRVEKRDEISTLKSEFIQCIIKEKISFKDVFYVGVHHRKRKTIYFQINIFKHNLGVREFIELKRPFNI